MSPGIGPNPLTFGANTLRFPKNSFRNKKTRHKMLLVHLFKETCYQGNVTLQIKVKSYYKRFDLKL